MFMFAIACLTIVSIIYVIYSLDPVRASTHKIPPNNPYSWKFKILNCMNKLLNLTKIVLD